ALLLTHCQSNISIEHEQTKPNNLDVTSFNIERDTSLRPTDWKVYKAGREVIIAPSDWTSYTDDSGLNIISPNMVDSSERIVFNRYAKEDQALNYDKVARQLAEKAFDRFAVYHNVELKKVELSQYFFYERTAKLKKSNINYEDQ
nr:hypothetical protein [Tanacetum cinerariifolium]